MYTMHIEITCKLPHWSGARDSEEQVYGLRVEKIYSVHMHDRIIKDTIYYTGPQENSR